MADIGEEKKSVDFEPIPESAPIEEPTPVVVPEKEDVPV